MSLAPRLILGLRPSSGVHEEILESPTTRRLDELMCGWRLHFDTRNLFTHADAGSTQDVIDAALLDQFIEDNGYIIVVALGLEVARELTTALWRGPWLGTSTLHLQSRDVKLLKLPHPSGLNRWYNDPRNLERASCSLRWAAGYDPDTRRNDEPDRTD